MTDARLQPSRLAGFFTAVTGAAAALAGLLFVAVSVNLKNILGEDKSENPVAGGHTGTSLASRAAETLAWCSLLVETLRLNRRGQVCHDLRRKRADTLA